MRLIRVAGAGATLAGAVAMAACSAGDSSAPGGTAGEGGVATGEGGPTAGLDAASSIDGATSADGSAVAADGASASPEGGACQLPPGAAAPMCFSSFAQVGPTVVTTTCMPGSPPQAQDGPIADGVYALQSRAAYGAPCPPAPDEEATLVICGSQWDWVIVYDPLADGQVPSTYAYRYTVTEMQGAMLMLTPQCTSDGSSSVDSLGYTYAGGTLTLISANSASTYVKR